MAEFYDVVTAQRACREFRDNAVPWEVLRRVLRAATHAPSAENRQPWRFVVVTDPGKREAIGELTRRAWEGGGVQHSQGRLPPKLLHEVDRGATGGVAGAPVLVVVGVDTSDTPPGAVDASIWPAAQNLLLAAGAEGLGSALTTLPAAFPDELSAIVDFPAAIQPRAVVPLGWPARPLGPPRRRPVDEVAWHDAHGAPLPD